MSSGNNNLITIIIPVYNAARFIADCIESIINQSVEYWELLLVDDGSIDGSSEICDKYAQCNKKIRVIHPANGGPGKARNTGINACNTTWFTFVDADDKIGERYIENFHVEQCENDCVLSCQGFVRVDTTGKTLGEEYNLKDKVYKGERFIDHAFCESDLYSFGQSVGKLYNKTLCDRYNIRLNTSFSWSEDHLFYLQYLLHIDEIKTHSGCLYFYQYAAGQQTLTHRPLPYKEAIKIFHNIYPAADALVRQYDLSSSAMVKKIYYHSVTAGFSIVLRNLYREEQDKSERRMVLRLLRKDMRQMREKYNPHGVKGKIIKPLLLWLPINLLDTMFSKIISR